MEMVVQGEFQGKSFAASKTRYYLVHGGGGGGWGSVVGKMRWYLDWWLPSWWRAVFIRRDAGDVKGVPFTDEIRHKNAASPSSNWPRGWKSNESAKSASSRPLTSTSRRCAAFNFRLGDGWTFCGRWRRTRVSQGSPQVKGRLFIFGLFCRVLSKDPWAVSRAPTLVITWSWSRSPLRLLAASVLRSGRLVGSHFLHSPFMP